VADKIVFLVDGQVAKVGRPIEIKKMLGQKWILVLTLDLQGMLTAQAVQADVREFFNDRGIALAVCEEKCGQMKFQVAAAH